MLRYRRSNHMFGISEKSRKPFSPLEANLAEELTKNRVNTV
jgi:hypothetical protein